MRTAIYLLIALAVATLVPLFVPQRISNMRKVIDISEAHPKLYEIFDRLRFFDVFSSPWYVAIYGSLLVVLVACLVPRTRQFLHGLRDARRPPAGGHLPRLPHTVEWRTDVAAAEAEVRIRSVLRRHRYRCGPTNESGQWTAEKGTAREGGSLLFHWSFFLLLVGLFVSRMFGFTAQAAIVEGHRWVEAPINMDVYNPGRFGGSTHRGFTVVLDDFTAKFRRDGSAMDFASRVRVYDGGRLVRRKTVRVNDPLNYRGVKLYQLDFGWAARLKISDSAGEVLFDDFVRLFSGGPRGSWTGVVKIPTLRPQAALEVWFFPSAQVLTPTQAAAFRDDLGKGVLLASKPGELRAADPAVYFREYRGSLGLEDAPQSVYDLDKELLGPAGDVGLAALDRGPFTLQDGLAVSFPELREYSVFAVKRDPGIGLVALAALLLLAGLFPSLYSSKRRLWVSVRPSGEPAEPGEDTPEGAPAGGNAVAFGGLAYHRKDAFADEFAELVPALQDRAQPRSPVPQEQ